jgi:hypothetical protein
LLLTPEGCARGVKSTDVDITTDDFMDLHGYGLSLDTRWVTIHDTAKDGTTP